MYDRTAWRQTARNGVRSFEAERLNTTADERQKRKAKEALDIKVHEKTASADFVRQICGLQIKFGIQIDESTTRRCITSGFGDWAGLGADLVFTYNVNQWDVKLCLKIRYAIGQFLGQHCSRL